MYSAVVAFSANLIEFFFLSTAENLSIVNGSSPNIHLMQPCINLSPTQTLSPLKTRKMRQGLPNTEPPLKSKQEKPMDRGETPTQISKKLWVRLALTTTQL